MNPWLHYDYEYNLFSSGQNIAAVLLLLSTSLLFDNPNRITAKVMMGLYEYHFDDALANAVLYLNRNSSV